MNNDCWLKTTCNKIDCNTFCIKYFKLNYLYNEALVSFKQRENIKLIIDADKTDYEAFCSLKNIQDSINNFVTTGNNLFIYSTNCGNGKTSWALRLLQTYFNNIWNKSALTCRGLFINVPQFLLALKENISNKSSYVEHIKQNILTCDLVIWDEIGSKGLSEFEHENILTLINARLDKNLSNIYTSNLSNADLHQALGDRLYSRIANNSYNIELKGSDKRNLKL